MELHNHGPSIISAIEMLLSAQPANPTKGRFPVMTTAEMPAELINALRSSCIVVERTTRHELDWSDAQAEWGTEAITVPIPEETCAELIYGKL